MSRDSGPALKALGRVSLIISIVAFAALGIIGYSLYEEATYVIDNFNNLQPNMTTPTENGIFAFKVNMTIPNKGLLPIHLMLGGDISSNATIIGSINQISETIRPGEGNNLVIDAPIDIASIKGGNITLSINGSVALQPFLSLGLATSIDFSIPGFDLSISDESIKITPLPIYRINASYVSIPLNIQFTNLFSDSVKEDMKIVLRSTPKTIMSNNYGETTFNIDLDVDEELIEDIEIVISDNIVSSGMYSFDLIFSIEEQDFLIRKEVNLVCDVCNE
ncbi:hypothetical protein ACFL96_18440 [Thermoproteota archaeon]